LSTPPLQPQAAAANTPPLKTIFRTTTRNSFASSGNPTSSRSQIHRRIRSKPSTDPVRFALPSDRHCSPASQDLGAADPAASPLAPPSPGCRVARRRGTPGGAAETVPARRWRRQRFPPKPRGLWGRGHGAVAAVRGAAAPRGLLGRDRGGRRGPLQRGRRWRRRPTQPSHAGARVFRFRRLHCTNICFGVGDILHSCLLESAEMWMHFLFLLHLDRPRNGGDLALSQIWSC
jgi:hypothetical protein